MATANSAKKNAVKHSRTNVDVADAVDQAVLVVADLVDQAALIDLTDRNDLTKTDHCPQIAQIFAD